MDIQSSVFNELFELYPVVIQGWVSPVKPDGVADGGIPKALYDDESNGLECLVDPWLEPFSEPRAVDDRVDLYVNDDPRPATGKTIQPGEEGLRIRLYLPHGMLRQGVNRLHYKVKRVGGNVESSRDLRVLYHLRIPDDLDLGIPPDVLKDGVDAAKAAQGVEFDFNYNNRRNYDWIEFLLGDARLRFDTPDAPAPITQKLFTDAFQKAGNNPSAVAEFIIEDQLGNRSKSPEKRLSIDLKGLHLPAPSVKNSVGDDFSPTHPEVRILVPEGALLPTDTLHVIWTGASDVPAGSYTSPKRSVSAGLEITVPPTVLAYSLGKSVTVTYVNERNGVPMTSLPLTLNILPLPVTALNSPIILEADASNVLDINALGSKNATIHALLWTLIEEGQPCWMSVEGKKADGSAHNLSLWSGLPARVTVTWLKRGYWPQTLDNNYLKALAHGSSLTIKFKASLDKSNVEATAQVFPDQVYTIKSIELPAPTIIEAPDNVSLDPLRATDRLTARVPQYPGMTKGDRIIATWTAAPGTPAGGSFVSPPMPVVIVGPQEIPLDNRVVAFSVGKDVTVKYTAAQGNSTPALSSVLNLKVLNIPDSRLPKPLITQATDNGEGPELIVGRLTETTLRINVWPLIALGQYVWLRLQGTNADGSDYNEVVWSAPGNSVSQPWLDNGFYQQTIEALSFLKDGSVLTVTFKAAFGQSVRESDATSFPVRSYFVKSAPTLVVDMTPVSLFGHNVSILGSGLNWTETGEYPEHTTTRKVVSGGTPPYTYTSSNTEIASVDQTGLVSSEGNGKCVITVIDALGQSVGFEVNTYNVSRLMFNPTPMNTLEGWTWIRRVMKGYRITDKWNYLDFLVVLRKKYRAPPPNPGAVVMVVGLAANDYAVVFTVYSDVFAIYDQVYRPQNRLPVIGLRF